MCIFVREWVSEREISSHSHFILPRCDVPLILIFSSQMRAILAIMVHFNFSPLNISFLWYLPLTASQVYIQLTFMCLQVDCNVHQKAVSWKINIPYASKYFISSSSCSLPRIISANGNLGYVNLSCYRSNLCYSPRTLRGIYFPSIYLYLLINIFKYSPLLSFFFIFSVPLWQGSSQSSF